VGPTARVAEKVIFGEVRELVRRSPWFAEKYPPDARVRKELHFAKNIAVIPGNSSELFPLGLNVLAATMDEASFFVETYDGQREAAEEVYLALQRRVKSRFGDKGLMMIASSPRHSEDFIMRKLAEAETTSSVYGSRKATWEVKPKSRFGKERFEYKGMKVPAEFQREFDKNAEKALRDLAARPGAAYAPFFVDMGGLEEAWGGGPHPRPLSHGERGERRDTASYPRPLPKGRGERRETAGLPPQPPSLNREGGERRETASYPLPLPEGRGERLAASRPVAAHTTPSLRHPFGEDGRLAEWFRAADRAARFVHVDLGLKKDACGIAMAKVEADGRGMPVVVVEMMNQIKAPPGGEVDFAGVRELILSLRGRGFRVARVTYDGWQSADSLQILRRKGIEAGVVPVALPEYETLKELANDRRLRMYEFRPIVEECKRLEMIRGVKVDHPPGGSKDVADAVAGAVSEALKGWRGEDEVRGRIV
jgi:hypothetical protein